MSMALALTVTWPRSSTTSAILPALDKAVSREGVRSSGTEPWTRTLPPFSSNDTFLISRVPRV
jgi:hypothetical protein